MLLLTSRRLDSDGGQMRLLADLLHIVPGYERLEWAVRRGEEDFESFGEASAFLESILRTGRHAPGQEVMRAASKGYGTQVIWATFVAYDPGRPDELLRISVIDGWMYRFEGDDDLLAEIERRATTGSRRFDVLPPS